MGKNDDEKRAEHQESKSGEGQKDKTWLQKNSGLVLGLGVLGLLVLACLVMKMCK